MSLALKVDSLPLSLGSPRRDHSGSRCGEGREQSYYHLDLDRGNQAGGD